MPPRYRRPQEKRMARNWSKLCLKLKFFTSGYATTGFHCTTVVEKRKEHRCKYWATRSSVRLFARTAHSLACSGLLASLRSLICSLAHFAHSLARGKVNDWMALLSVFFLFSTIVYFTLNVFSSPSAP